MDERTAVLQYVQPGLIGLIDGTISTLAPIFATAYLSGSHNALLVGLAAALGAAIWGRNVAGITLSILFSTGIVYLIRRSRGGTLMRPAPDHRYQQQDQRGWGPRR